MRLSKSLVAATLVGLTSLTSTFASAVSFSKPAQAACHSEVWEKNYWWGTQIYYNKCALNYFTSVVGAVPYTGSAAVGVLQQLGDECGNGILLDEVTGLPPRPKAACGLNLKDGFQQIPIDQIIN